VSGRVRVAVALPLPLRQTFTYEVPEGWDENATPGTRVRVPFGERALTGIIVGPGHVLPDAAALREIEEILDEDPVIGAELLEVTRRAAERAFCGWGEVLRAALPSRLAARGTLRYEITERGAFARREAKGRAAAILDALLEAGRAEARALPGRGRDVRATLRDLEARGWVRAVSSVRETTRRVERAYAPIRISSEERAERLGRSRRGASVLLFLESLGRAATGAEIRESTGAGSAVIADLSRKGLLASFEQERPLDAAAHLAAASETRIGALTAAQEAALSAVSSAITEKRFFPALLFGVTGSGKTEVYLRAIADALEAGRGAIWLVPEIALTPVFARGLRQRFGDRAAVLHSAISESDRLLIWQRIRGGEIRAVIGPRSAVFAPVEDPGIIVVDEEQDASYKQDESPRYDARDIAYLRARAHGSPILLGSATPSMETYFAAREGKLAKLRLPERIERRPLPEVRIVDLRREKCLPEERGVPLYSASLTDRLHEVFAAGEQAILLLPRRGYAPTLLCRDCGNDFRCSRCSVTRTVHRRDRMLICHYCGERIPIPRRCPQCGGDVLEAVGAGTERAAERFAQLFPDTPYAVLDRDAARRRGGAAAIISQVVERRVQCLIGTQMVAKGHDFPGVTAIGILSADGILNFPDFRAAEKTFQLITQAAGRAGRGDEPGTVHIQTFHPGHEAITAAATHDVEGFAEKELVFRKAFFYPPFSELAEILVSSPRRERAEEVARDLAAPMGRSGTQVRVSGPAPAPLERLQGQWRFQILARSAKRRALLEALAEAIPVREPGGASVTVDVDPQNLM
jgi:primosomal protein N' (replication factor Y) (superfamily II helicase)